MKFFRFSTFLAFPFLLSALAAAQDSVPLAHHVSANVPVQGSSRELSAERLLVSSDGIESPLEAPAAHNWQLQATLPGAVIHDLSFASPSIGYAAAELGQVWKTTNGGKSWSEILNLGGPYYFYGVTALTANDVAISGFYDSSSFEGIVRWSHDGGATWSGDIVLSTQDWVQRVRFANTNHGLIMDLTGGSSGNTAQFTANGGAVAADWKTVIDNSDGGWFGLQYSFLPDLHARASGINFCSSNGGAVWNCVPSVDSVFDGPVFFLNDSDGWVGGGEISPNVEGWVHVTTDGGATWSTRTLDDPWPIRQILFLNAKSGWAAGGNIYTGVGGMYFSNNGGLTWSVDATTNAEMDACDKQQVSSGYRIWCAGYDSSFNGVIYSLYLK